MPRKSFLNSSKESTDSGSIDKYLTCEMRKRKCQAAAVDEPAGPPCQEDENSTVSEQVTKRRQEFYIENRWIPICGTASPTTAAVTVSHVNQLLGVTASETAAAACSLRSGASGSSSTGGMTSFRFQNYFTTPLEEVRSPLPHLAWADRCEVWLEMLKRESKYHRDPKLFARHQLLQPHMRAILLDWLIEVCEVHRLHRQTFYLTVDFVDRYLSVQTNVHKTQLQLIGITALFIAAKLEEIYPPKVAEFAYVTDGACSETDIINQELIMLKSLKWEVNPVTVNNWITAYMQLLRLHKSDFLAAAAGAQRPVDRTGAASSGEHKNADEADLLVPCFSGRAFAQLIRLTDLCMLEVGCLHHSYSVIAASALYHMSAEKVALGVSGYGWGDIAPCVAWMAPFALAVRQKDAVRMPNFDNVAPEDAHNVQSHCGDLTLLEVVRNAQARINASLARSSPDTCGQPAPGGVLTPPPSHEKSSGSSPH